MGLFHRLKMAFLHDFEMTKVFALVGSSGSGKSYNVQNLVDKYDIDLVIDDGLLIKNNKVLGGVSAKQEKNEMLAVKCAIFLDYKHRSSIREMIDMEYYPRILVLGTSEKMISRIVTNLCLPRPAKIIKIEDIRSKEDIEYAHRVRNTQGKHIIPLPYIEIKRYLDEHRGNVYVDEAFLNRKTIVSPYFSRSSVISFSLDELRIVVEGIVKSYDRNLVVSDFKCESKVDKARIMISVKNVINPSVVYNTAELLSFLNKNLSKRVDDAVVEGISCMSGLQ